MAKRFGEEVSDQDAYNTARNAAGQMSTQQLAAQQGQPMGPNQQQALADELAARNGQ